MKSHHSKSDVEQMEINLQSLKIPISIYYVTGSKYQVLLNDKTICTGTSKEIYLFLDGIRRGYEINH